MNDKEIIVSLLSVKGIGNMTIFKFYEELKSFKDIERYFIHGDHKNLSNKSKEIKNALCENVGKRYLETLHRYGGDSITYFEKKYPAKLKEIYNPPIFLQYIGNLEKLNFDDKKIAIVGARKATDYGKKVAYDLGYNLALNGISVISGLAYGIDGSAHRGVVDGAGFPIGVIGNGLDQIYPLENSELYRKIKKDGILVTEEFLYSKPAPHKFPLRNRIISGLCDGIVVVEANEKSGSLITANYGLEQGKTIFSVPGGIYSQMSKGCNKLIKDGAFLLESYEDIMKEFDLNFFSKLENLNSVEKIFSDTEKLILNLCIEYGNLTIEKISEMLEIEINDVISAVTAMEIRGVIKNMGINEYFIEKKR